jgi:hypothetical protein
MHDLSMCSGRERERRRRYRNKVLWVPGLELDASRDLSLAAAPPSSEGGGMLKEVPVFTGMTGLRGCFGTHI